MCNIGFMSEKECTKCGEAKPFIAYSKDKQKSDGLTSNCNSCLYEHREANRTRLAQEAKKYRVKNKQKIAESRALIYSKRKDDAAFKIEMCLRQRLYATMKGKAKSETTNDLLGCDYDHARQHLENQFTDGMAWNNHGVYGWHIDHIKPCASFDLSEPEQQRACFHYTNLQPLWAKDNIKKSDKILNQ